MASTDKLTLPRRLGDRVKLLLLSSFISGFMCFMVGIMFEWKPLGIAEHLIHAIGL